MELIKEHWFSWYKCIFFLERTEMNIFFLYFDKIKLSVYNFQHRNFENIKQINFEISVNELKNKLLHSEGTSRNIVINKFLSAVQVCHELKRIFMNKLYT